ncbi:tetratricopeptide repeat protein [Pseudomonas sp. Marseille-Q1929]|uniref:tetratricopeptide repeat protein n=1 Tax=Pseudomonas sp. Marseille-Q1929 TaxID=2730402 RepID=UPI001A8ED37D|nr:tetratricopeptide repeat protein [Pseudomonas sp. Marseille-Q1929]MBO0494395.1 tetratricopeptide repeat protein [Pseudomonas sp. Marseille-Q1929]
MADSNVTEWTLDGVLDEMSRIHSSMKDRQFAFILGAGASFTSGIPTGQHLAQRWLKDLHLRECGDNRSLNEWITSCGVDDLTWETAAENYPKIFERRFDGDREAGYAELEAAMEGKSPSLGYSLLAEIIQHTRHKVVVTTNFDNLVADALAMHAHQSPLVVAHESLAGFVRPQLRRPLVAKIHRDLYLHPINDAVGVSTMEQGWKIALKKLFQYFTPVVVGYGGNDGSLMNMLMGLELGDIAGRMIWCYRDGSPPPEKALNVLEKHRGVIVKIPGFDQFMLQLAAKLVSDFDVAAIAERTAQLGQERAVRYREQASKLSESFAHGTPEEQRSGAILTQSVRQGRSWWSWEIQAREELDPDKRNKIYLEGIEVFPRVVELARSYALFLANELGDHDAAHQMFKKALELDSQDVTTLVGYARFLVNARRDLDSAEEVYNKALGLDPGNEECIEAYAVFLAEEREDLKAGAEVYRKSLEVDPRNAAIVGSYARFLEVTLEDLDSAEKMYKKSLDLDPSSADVTGGYANFLAENRNEPDVTDSLFRKSIDLNPSDAWNICTYAKFLQTHLQNYESAELLFKKALNLEPKSGWIAASYAEFLAYAKEDFDLAEIYYKSAIGLSERSVWVIGVYAAFLEKVRENYVLAESLYERAFEMSPTSEWIVTSYAELLENHRKDCGAAREVYQKALKADPANKTFISNYRKLKSKIYKSSAIADAVEK